MNWDLVRNEMKQVRELLKQKWAELTDDDLLLLKGGREIFMGRLQQRTGLAAEEVEREFAVLVATLDPSLAHPPAIIHLGTGDGR